MGVIMKTLLAIIIAALLASPVATADTYYNMYAATDWLAKKYNVHVYTANEWMEDGTYAITDGDTIVFNSAYVNNPDQLMADMTNDMLTGWHHGLRCTPEQYIAAHEFGHVLDNLDGHTADYELAYALSQGLSGFVSGYAVTNYDEALAESFAAVECDTPTPVEQSLYTMLTT